MINEGCDMQQIAYRPAVLAGRDVSPDDRSVGRWGRPLDFRSATVHAAKASVTDLSTSASLPGN